VVIDIWITKNWPNKYVGGKKRIKTKNRGNNQEEPTCNGASR